MKELRHIRRSRERRQARRARRAAWWRGQEPMDSYGMRAWIDWARHAVEPDLPDRLGLDVMDARARLNWYRLKFGLAS